MDRKRQEQGRSICPVHAVALAASLLIAATMSGCAGRSVIDSKASTSAIHSAEQAGAASNSSASYFLELAKEELEAAANLAAKGNKEEAEYMLLRAQVDAGLAMVLSRRDTDKIETTQATQRLQKLRDDYHLLKNRK